MVLPIAIDAMGGDHAPREVVRGAVEASRDDPATKLLLVGREPEVRAELDAAGWTGSNVEVVRAEQVIGMGDSPIEALRKKRGNSIEVATRLVKTGAACAMVSAGNTGACVASGTIHLGLLPEVKRAGIAVVLKAGDQPVVVIDVGANVASRPEHLIQYAVMASHYARSVIGVESPRIGLLNIGEEDEKGNSLTKSARALFQSTKLNFVGNVEGVEIFRGVCDVVVCDGFVGNIVLKTSEGLAERLMQLFKSALDGALKGDAENGAAGRGAGDLDQRMLGLLDSRLRDVFLRLRQRLDYSEYGGAPLLGVSGVMIIAHGRSDARAVANAIRVAKRMAVEDVNRRITEEIEALNLGDAPGSSACSGEN